MEEKDVEYRGVLVA